MHSANITDAFVPLILSYVNGVWLFDSACVVVLFFFTVAQFSPEVKIVGQYPSCLQGSFLDNGTGLSGKSRSHSELQLWTYLPL